MSDCVDCSKRAQGGCEKHPQKICTIPGCDRKCGSNVHGTIRRKPIKLPRFNFIVSPNKDIKEGLMILINTNKGVKQMTADIVKGKRIYGMPDVMGNIRGVYLKIK